MSVGQPCMKREERHLHSKSNKEAEEKPERCVLKAGNATGTDRVLDDYEIKAAGLRVEP